MISSISDRITLANGVAMPAYGGGVFKVDEARTTEVVRGYLETGFRLIDTAAMYGNEAGVGRGIRESGIAREDVFITTKIWDHPADAATVIRSFEESLRLLGTDYVDLYLIHWPKPALGRYVTIWQGIEEIYRSGRARAIGVCNFQPDHLDHLAQACDIMPMVNQVEVHPYLTQKALLDDHRKRGIVVQAWAPLARGHVAEDPVLCELGRKHGKSPAQVTLRWHLQNGISAIPKSASRERTQENAQIFDFGLDAADMAQIDALNRNQRTGPHPDTMNSN